MKHAFIRLVALMALATGSVATTQASEIQPTVGPDLSPLPVHCLAMKTKRTTAPLNLWGGGTAAPCTGENLAIYAPIVSMGKVIDLYINPEDFLVERTSTCFFDRSAIENIIRKLVDGKVCSESSVRANGAGGTRSSAYDSTN